MTPLRARTLLGWTQKRIAKTLGLSERFWQYREWGDRKTEPWLKYALIGLVFTHRKDKK